MHIMQKITQAYTEKQLRYLVQQSDRKYTFVHHHSWGEVTIYTTLGLKWQLL